MWQLGVVASACAANKCEMLDSLVPFCSTVVERSGSLIFGEVWFGVIPVRQFTKEDMATIASGVADGRKIHQIVCPNCRKTTLRWYRQVSLNEVRAVAFSYTWCIKCRSAISSTGPAGSVNGSPGEGNSVLATVEKAISGVHDLDEMIEVLNAFWDRAILPNALLI